MKNSLNEIFRAIVKRLEDATLSRILAPLALVLSLALPALALDATQAVRRDVTPKSSIPTGTVATWPMDAAVPPGWLACNGQSVPSSYPELRTLMASVPNYNNKQFLRGATSGAGSSVADSTRSHTHAVPAHSHTVSGSAAGQSVSVGGLSVSGTAAGQQYLDAWTGMNFDSFPNPTFAGPVVTWVGGEGVSSKVQTLLAATSHASRTASSSSVTGTTSTKTFTTTGGTITGYTNAVGQSTEASGGSETAPMHTLVKYIIKAD